MVYILYLIFFNVYFIFERVCVPVGEGQRDRETQNLKQTPGTELSTQSPARGLNSQTGRS